MKPASWIQNYLAYDEATLAGLSNSGTVRRAVKQYSEQQPEVIESTQSELRFLIQGYETKLLASGPANSSCSCPVSGICVHLLQAILHTKTLAESQLDSTPTKDFGADDPNSKTEASSPKRSNSEPDPQSAKSKEGKGSEGDSDSSSGDGERSEKIVPLADPLLELLKLPAEQYLKGAGIKSARSVFLKFGNFDPQQLEALKTETQVSVAAQKVVISWPELAGTVSYLAGLGFGQMVVTGENSKSSRLGELRLEAIYRVFLKQEQLWDWPESLKPSDSQPVDRANSEQLDCIHQIQNTISRLILTGLSQISESSLTQLSALQLSARIAGLVTLGQLTGRASGLAKQLSERSDELEESELLTALAELWAHCEALKQAEGESLRRLKGFFKRNFEGETELKLQTIGVNSWVSDSGARGVSVEFCAVDNPEERYSVTAARAAGIDPSFVVSEQLSEIWGVQLSRLLEKQFRLRTAKLSEDSVLSTNPANGYQELKQNEVAVSELLEKIAITEFSRANLASALGTSQIGQLNRNLILAPSRLGVVSFDETSQQLVWPIFDLNMNPLELRIDLKADRDHRVKSIMDLSEQKAEIAYITVQAVQVSQKILLESNTVFVRQKDTLEAIALDFYTAPTRYNKKPGFNFLEKLAKLRKQPTNSSISLQRDSAAPINLIAEVIELATRVSAYGNSSSSVLSKQQIKTLANKSSDLGLLSLSSALGTWSDSNQVSDLLRCVYLCQKLGWLALSD